MTPEPSHTVLLIHGTFAASPDDYPAAVARAIGLGNDTDTLAAMAGALCGARLGAAAIPAGLIEKLEDDHAKGRRHLETLADGLFGLHRRRWIAEAK